jgi:hypothetical protein
MPLIPRAAGAHATDCGGDQIAQITCAQIAIIPTNNASDVSAAAS